MAPTDFPTSSRSRCRRSRSFWCAARCSAGQALLRPCERGAAAVFGTPLLWLVFKGPPPPKKNNLIQVFHKPKVSPLKGKTPSLSLPWGPGHGCLFGFEGTLPRVFGVKGSRNKATAFWVFPLYLPLCFLVLRAKTKKNNSKAGLFGKGHHTIAGWHPHFDSYRLTWVLGIYRSQTPRICQAKHLRRELVRNLRVRLHLLFSDGLRAGHTIPLAICNR